MASIRVGGKASLTQIARPCNLRTKGGKMSARVSTPKVCEVTDRSIKGLAPGTCMGTITVRRAKGRPASTRFALAITREQ